MGASSARTGRRVGESKWLTNPALAGAVSEKLRRRWSPQQIAGWLKVTYPDNQSMQVSHESIYRTLFMQSRGALRRELTHPFRPSAPPEGRRCSSQSWCPASTRNRRRAVARDRHGHARRPVGPGCRGGVRRRRQRGRHPRRAAPARRRRPGGLLPSLSRNFGKEAAMLAGLHTGHRRRGRHHGRRPAAPAAAAGPDAALYRQGFDQVIARRDRRGDRFVRTVASGSYYRLINWSIDVRLEDGAGDFRLLSPRRGRRHPVDAGVQPVLQGPVRLDRLPHRGRRLPQRGPRAGAEQVELRAAARLTASTG